MYARDYNVMDIEADKLTHLMYAFYNATFDAQTETGAIASLDAWADVSDTQIATGAGTLKNLVHRINKEFDTRRTQDGLNMLYGWQLNLWSKNGGGTTVLFVKQIVTILTPN